MADHKSVAINERSYPSITHPHYLMLKGLSESIIEWTRLNLRYMDKIKVLDIGCGDRPYNTFFLENNSLYLGIDIIYENADCFAVGENLPFKDQSFDIVLSTQVLEHVDNPEKCIKEVYRILKYGGNFICSTHGTWNYHGSPNYPDYWRWTREGFEKLLSKSFGKNLIIKDIGGPITTYFQILNIYISGFPVIQIFKVPLFVINNLIGRLNLDRFHQNKTFNIIYFAICKKG